MACGGLDLMRWPKACGHQIPNPHVLAEHFISNPLASIESRYSRTAFTRLMVFPLDVGLGLRDSLAYRHESTGEVRQRCWVGDWIWLAVCIKIHPKGV